MSYRLVVFDFDGTLADSFGWFIGVFNGVADRYRFRRIAEDEVESLRGYGGRELARHLGIPGWKLPFIAAHVRRLKARDAAGISLFPGIAPLLGRLAERGVTLAVVSSNAEANVRRILGPGNAALVRHYDCGAAVFGKKSAFRRVLRRAAVGPADALCVGDEIRDADAAREAGIDFAGVAWGFTTPAALLAQRPVALFHSLAELEALVLSLDPLAECPS